MHVELDQPQSGLRSMDPVSVSGLLTTTRHDSVMGKSGYSMQAVRVEPCAPAAR